METIVTEVMDDKSVSDARGRRITNKDRRAELVAEYKTSGMTQKAFAKRAGVNAHTFVAWLANERRGGPGTSEAGGAPGKAMHFIELGAPARAMQSMLPLEVVLPGGRVVRGADARALAELVRQLER